MSPEYNISVDNEGESVVTIVNDGEVVTITGEHPNYRQIVAALLSGEDPFPLLSVGPIISDLSEDFEYDEDTETAFFRGEPIPDPVPSTMLRYAAEGRDMTGFPKFMEHLASNPSMRSREQLWNWLGRQGLTIDAEGFIIGFKGVRNTDDLSSVTAGDAMVDGVPIHGHIPNRVGTVVSMDRAKVMDDASVGCSYGLHVGTWSYARTFGQVVLEVKVNPADVVSVPSDSFDKLRCCRYEVAAVHDRELGADLSHHEPEPTWTPQEFVDAMTDVLPPEFFNQLVERLKNRGRAATENE